MHRYSVVKWTGLVAIAALAACSGKTPSADEELQRDLKMANGAMLDLAPQGGSNTQVVSAVERSPESSTSERRQAPKRVPNVPEREVTPTPTPAADVAEVAVAPAGEPTPVPTPDIVPVIAAPQSAPLPRPAATPQRRGGYKTVGDVIRNAPFPVNP